MITRKKPPKKRDRRARWIRVDSWVLVNAKTGNPITSKIDRPERLDPEPGYRWLRCVGYLPPPKDRRLS
jgi:hypothetical protein